MTRSVLVIAALLALAPLAGAQGTQATRRAQDAGLRYSVPQSWERVPASSDMRAAQYRIPGASAAADDDAEVVLFYFGQGQGGTTEANLERWYGQFTQPDGKPSRDAARMTKRTVNGLQVTAVNLSGTYTAQMRPGEGAKPRPDTRMLAAAIEGAHGPWFFRIVGPEATVAAAAPDFDQLLLSLEAHQ